MAIHEIRVFPKDDDPRAAALSRQAQHMLGIDIDVVTAKVFSVEGVNDSEAERLARELFADPVTEGADTSSRNDWDNPNRVEVAYKPGVMNPEAESILKGANLLGISPVAVDSSTEYRFSPTTSADNITRVASELLVNKTVQHIRLKSPDSLIIRGEVGSVETIPITSLTASELAELSKARSLFLDPAELQTLQDYFKEQNREPTDAELEAIAGRWSEHCGHKTFNAKIFKDGKEKDPLFKRIKDTARLYFDEEITGAFDDNAGTFLFYDGYCICIKLETHNSPSALEPYGGAATGVGGVLRDIMGTGQGAKIILSIDIFCFASPDLVAEELPTNCLAPAYLQQRVIDGVRDYGNRMGIPTANGSIHYHPDFRAKPTVMVGALGIMPEKYAHKGVPKDGDLVVTVGGRTGRDGIHGATFSSGTMTSETSTIHSSAVQIGNAIEEKKMADALLEARDAGCIRAITDCGAAGFSSAIGEMGEDIGVTVDIAKAPLKYEGLAPWEIWMSESQERMIAAVIPEKIEEFSAICIKHEVESTVLGTFGTADGDPRLVVTYGDNKVVDLDYEFLKNGLAQREMIANWQAPNIIEIEPVITDWDSTIRQVLSHGNVCSKEPVVRQYDHEVQGGTVVKPFGGVKLDAPNDGVVLTPILGKPYGLVEAHGMNPALNNIDPYRGSVWAIAEAMANYAVVGGDPDKAVLVGNYVTATPDEHVMGALDKMVDAVCDGMHAFKRPVISGKDSLSSRYKGSMPGGKEVIIDIPPVLNMTVAGKIPNVAKTVTSDIKMPGSVLVLVGSPDYESMGGSTLYDVVGASSAHVPKIDLHQLAENLRAVHRAIQHGKVLASHDVSEGGVVATVAEMAFGGDCGVELNLHSEAKAAQQLFNETAGGLVVEVNDEQTASELFGNIPYQILGKTVRRRTIDVTRGGEQMFSLDIDELKAAWKQPMQEQLA